MVVHGSDSHGVGAKVGRWLAMAATLGLLAACASEARYQEILAGWTGAREAQLVAAWGAPDSFYTAGDETRYLTYRRSRTIIFPGTLPTTKVDPVSGLVTTTPGTRDVPLDYSCKTTFVVVDGRVVDWRYQGNGCTAR